MQKLVDGVHRFQEDVFGSDTKFYEDLAHGQAPEALFITCSDSRVNPNLITQTKPGELFILRNAGNIVPPYGAVKGGEAATIEYAVLALGVRDIIVCGHSHCGAMTGLLDPAGLVDMPAISSWLEHAESTRRIMRENYPHLAKASPALLHATVQENALVQVEHLETHPVVAARLARHELHVHAWFYKIETGEVFYYDGPQGQYRLLSAVSGEPSSAASSPGRRQRAAAI